MQIRIALLVGSNGKVSASWEPDVDWGIMADNLMDYPTKESFGVDPDAVAKYWVTVDVPVPEVKEVEGSAEPA